MEKINPEKYNKVSFPVVKAGATCILEKDNKILLGKRNINPEKGKWGLPGGHIDVGETAVESIRREVKEETGLKIKNLNFLFYHDEFLPKLLAHNLALVFHGIPEGKEKINSEVTEQKWFSTSEIKKINLSFEHGKMIDRYLKENGTK